MNTLVISIFACLALATAKPSGFVLKGPSGIVTDHGAIGPAGNHDGDDGQWHGDWNGDNEGRWNGDDGENWNGDNGGWNDWGNNDDGKWDGDDGQWHGDGHYSDVVVGNGAKLVGASNYRNEGGHGVVVRGPPTAPADIVGPSGKVLSHGLWGPIHDHHVVHHW